MRRAPGSSSHRKPGCDPGSDRERVVVLRPGAKPSNRLAKEIQIHGKKTTTPCPGNRGHCSAPKGNGKIRRYGLREQEMKKCLEDNDPGPIRPK